MEKIKKWLCLGCHFLLGYVEDGKVLRIKRKDLYVQVSGGQVMINCCRCGKVNHLSDDGIGEVVNLQENLTGKEE